MKTSRRGMFGAAAVLAGWAGAARAQSPEERERERRQREDWAWLGRYAEDNARLKAAGTPVATVFMGDSITEAWPRHSPDLFTPARVGRGIGGQTTPQMLVRTMQDVVSLRPRFVHIMGGTNDVAGNTGPMPRQQSFDNLAAMGAIARANGIGVSYASVPPADAFPWRPGLEPAAPIREINAWLRAHAAGTGATYVDYTDALGLPSGAMKPGLAYDGVHPNEAGYRAMAAVLAPVLERLGG